MITIKGVNYMKKVMRLLFLLALTFSMLLVTISIASASYENDGYGHEGWRYGFPRERAVYDYQWHRYHNEYYGNSWGNRQYYGDSPYGYYDYHYDRHDRRHREKSMIEVFFG